MSKRANGTGSRAGTHREQLVSVDPDFAEKEFQKRRSIRLEQARQPPKYIAEDVRNKVRKEKTKQFCSLQKRSERELKKWQDRKLVAPQQQYQECLKYHIEATIEEQPNEVVESQKKGHDHVSQQRGERTNRGLQKQKQQLQISKSTSCLRKKHVQEVEKARSAHVINLNKKKNNSAFKKNKRKGVLSATACPSRLCKRCASESEIKELLEFYSSSCSSKNGTFKSASTEKNPSEKLKYVRGDYNRLNENANVALPPKQEHDRKVFITNYVDTQTSARIKRRTFKGDFNEPIRNMYDNIIRDVNTKKKTRYEGPIKSYNKKHSEPDHLNKRRISNSEQPMQDFIKNGDGKSSTKPPVSSRTAPANAIPTKCSKGVMSATSSAKRVQCYDHKNRYFKEYVRNNANVEETDIDRIDKVRAYTDSEPKLVEKMCKRDSDAELRENKAPKKIKVQRNYEELMQQLPILKNRIASIPIHKTTYHMFENKPKELHQKRQKRMENVYESLSPKRQVITTPSKRHSPSTSNNLPFRAINIKRTSPVLDFKTKEKKTPNTLHKNMGSDLIREAEKVAEIPANADVPSQRGENLQKLLTPIPVDIHHHQLFDRFDNIDAFIYVGDTATKKSSTSNQQQRSRFRHETNTTTEGQNVKASSSIFSPSRGINKSANNFANEIPSLQRREKRGSKYHTSFAGSHSAKFCMRCGCAEHAKHACEIVIKVNEKGEPEICLSPIKLKDVREAVSISKSSLKMPNLEMSKEKKKVTSKLDKLDKPKLVDEQKTKAVEVSKVRKPKQHTSFERSGLLWRDLFSQNYSNSRTSYYGPPTPERAQGHSAAPMQKVKTDFSEFFLKKPRQGNLPNAHICCCSVDATETLTSCLDQHNKRLPMMSHGSFDELDVSSDSDMPDDSHIYYNTPKSSNSFKRDAQIQSPGDARKMALEEYTEENYPGILLAYNKLAENFVKKIENSAINEKVKQDKLSLLQSHTSLSDNKNSTKYMKPPTKFKQQKSSGEHKASHSDAEQQELDRQLLEKDYSFVEQLEKMTAADAADEQEDNINIKLLQRYKNLLERHTANDQVDNKQQKEYVRSTKQGLQPTTLEMVGDNSANELENIESVLKRMGMGWAVATLRKTQESLALTSSSSNSVDVGTKQKAIKQRDSETVSVRNKRRGEILAKLSSSAKTQDSSTFPPSSNEFQNTSAIHTLSVCQEKALLRASTPTQTSRLTNGRSKNDTQPRTTITAEPGKSSANYSYANVDGARFYSLKEQSPIERGTASSNTVEFQNMSAFRGSPKSQRKISFQTSTPKQSSYSIDDRSRNDIQTRYTSTGKGSPEGQEEVTPRTYTPIQSSYSTDDRWRSNTQPRCIATGEDSVIRQDEATLRIYTPIQTSYSTDDKRRSDTQPRYITTGRSAPIRRDEATLRPYTPIESSYSTDDRRKRDTQPHHITTDQSSPISQNEATLRPYTPIQSSYSTDDRRKRDTQPHYITTGKSSPIRRDEATLRPYTPIESSYSTDDRRKRDTQPHYITTDQSSPISQNEATLRPYTPIQSSYSTDDRRKRDTQPHYITTGKSSPIRQDEATLRPYTPIQSSYPTDDRRKSDTQPRYITTRQGSPIRQDEAILRTYTPIQSSYSTDDRRGSGTQPHYITTGQRSPIRQDEAMLRPFTPIQSSYPTDDRRSSDTQPRYIITGKSSPIRQAEANLRLSTPIQNSYPIEDRRKNDTQPRYITTRQGSPIRQDEATLRTYTPIQSSYPTDDRRGSSTQPRYITTGQSSPIRQDKAILQPYTPIQSSYSSDDRWNSDTQPPYITTGKSSPIHQDEATLRTYTPIQSSYSTDDKRKSDTQPRYITTRQGSPIRQDEATLRPYTYIQSSYSTNDRRRSGTQPRYVTTGEGSAIRQVEGTLRSFTSIQISYSIDDNSRNGTQPSYIITGADSFIRQEKTTLSTTTPIQNSYSIDDNSKSDTQPSYVITGEDSSIRQQEATLRTSTPIQNTYSIDDRSRSDTQPSYIITGEGSTIRQEEATLRTSTPMRSSKSTDDKSGNIYQPRITTAGEDLMMRQQEATLRTSTPIQNTYLIDDRSKSDTQPRYIITGEGSSIRQEEDTLRTSTPIGSSRSTDDTSGNISQPPITLAGEGLMMLQEDATLLTSTPIQDSYSTEGRWRSDTQASIIITGEGLAIRQEETTLRASTSIQSSNLDDDRWRNDTESRYIITGEDSPMRQEEATLRTSTLIGSSKSTPPRITETAEDSTTPQEGATLCTFTPIRSSKATDDLSRDIYLPRIAETAEDSTMPQKGATLCTFTPIRSSKATDDLSRAIYLPRIAEMAEDSTMRQAEATLWTVESNKSTDQESRNISQPRITGTGTDSSIRQEEASLQISTPIRSSKPTDNKSEVSPFYSLKKQSSSNSISTSESTTSEDLSMGQEKATLQTSTPIQSSKSPGGESKDISQPRIPILGDSEISFEKYAYAKVEGSPLSSLRKQSSIKSGSSSGSASESTSESTSSTSSNVDFKDILAIQGLSACKEGDNLRTSTPTKRSKSTDNKSKNISKAHITVTGEDSLMRQQDTTFPTSTAIQSGIACDDKSNNISQSPITMTGKGRSMNQEEAALGTSTPIHSELSELKSALVRMGKGCCPFGSIRRMRAALALTSGLRSYVDAGVEQKQIKLIDSDSVSFKDALEREILDKLSSSSTTTDDSSTFSPFSNEFQNTSAIKGSSISQGKATFWTSTHIENSKSNADISENSSQPRVTLTGESKVTSVKYSYANVDGALFYRIMEQLSITSETSSETTSGSTTSTSSSIVEWGNLERF